MEQNTEVQSQIHLLELNIHLVVKQNIYKFKRH